MGVNHKVIDESLPFNKSASHSRKFNWVQGTKVEEVTKGTKQAEIMQRQEYKQVSI